PFASGMYVAKVTDKTRTEVYVRVLIVEDDETFCAFLMELLQGQGNEVVCSTDGVDGYEKTRSYPYDLIILDVRMPGLLGTEIAEALKQRNPAVKVILISAFADASLREAAGNLGTPLLSKPFSPSDLFRAINDTTGEQA
ncbi:MAG TPA: response regulator, partial [Candidatus Binatia bacterium]|nr:response regulator [Candidatus Binatia bacterium]